MKKFRYILAAAVVSASLASCSDDGYPNIGTLEGIDMVMRSASIADGDILRPMRVNQISLVYNNLVGIDSSLAPTLNGVALTATVNPDNHMELLIPLTLADNTEYELVIPAGYVYRSDDKSVIAEARTIKFSTSIGVNASLVDPNLTNSAAIQPAKDLYAYLLANYGKKTLSGAMGEVAWGQAFTNYIASVTGHTPKVVGFDYIHLASSQPGGWIDYSNITPVKAVHDAGGIVTVNWHWLTPASTDGYLYYEDKEMPADWSGSIQLSADWFNYAEAGDVVTVNISNPADNAQGSFKNGSTWAGLTYGGVSYEYFDLCETDDEGNVTSYPSQFSLTLEGSLLDEVKSNGLIISGHDYTVTSVAYSGYLSRDLSGSMSYNNTFSPLKAITAGTGQNVVAEADVATLAGYLSLLQDAGIPVLFRPFHEAAGDYSYGAWFWWGNDGVEGTKQLWTWLYNKLTKEYGLNNLIWVWTMQTSDGGALADVSKLQEAYPGDNYVDIVGCDLYEEALSNQTDKFDLVNAAVDRKKMVALSECGNLLSVDEALADNAMWLYFMSWYDADDNMNFGFYGWNNDVTLPDGTVSNPWQIVLDSPYVINR